MNVNIEWNEKQEVALGYLLPHFMADAMGIPTASSNDKIKEVGFGGAAGGGKSFFGTGWTWTMCTAFDNVHYFWGRNEIKKIKDTTFESYMEFCDKYQIPKNWRGEYKEQKGKIYFPNGSKISMIELKYKPSDPFGTSLGSLLFTGGFIDQSEEVDSRMVDKIYTRVGRWKNDHRLGFISAKILESFNPLKNHVHQRFIKENRPNRAFVKALVTDWLKYPDYFFKNLQVHPSEEKTWYGQYILGLLERDMVTVQRLLYGNFNYDDDPTRLIEYDAMTDMLTNNFRFIYEGEQRYITTDIAMFGADKFTIWVWQGWKVLKIIVIDKCGGRKIVEKLNEVASEYGVPRSNICYDADGIGSYLKGDEGYFSGAMSFQNNGKTIKEVGQVQEYKNLRSQCWFGVARKINNNEVWIPGEVLGEYKQELFEELEQIKNHRPDMDEKLMATPKPDIKKNIGRSTDLADPLMMRYIFDLKGGWSSYA